LRHNFCTSVKVIDCMPVLFATVVIICCPRDFFIFVSIFAIFIHSGDDGFYCRFDGGGVVIGGVTWFIGWSWRVFRFAASMFSCVIWMSWKVTRALLDVGECFVAIS
jgi:hypothetical protein